MCTLSTFILERKYNDKIPTKEISNKISPSWTNGIVLAIEKINIALSIELKL